MATTPQQGIMALPETDEATTPQLSLNESYGAAKEGLADADPQYAAMYDDAMAKAMPALMALSDEELDSLLQIVQYLQEDAGQYKARLAELENAKVIDKGDFPEEYDENFLAVFGAAVLEAQRTNEDTGAGTTAMQPPMQLAKGGIAEAARMVAKQGRSGDTMLAHINKDEAALLKKHGGWGTINPRTGLPEYGGLGSFVSSVTGAVSGAVKGVTGAVSSAIKSVGSAVKQVLASPVGKIVATVALASFLGPAGAAMGGGFFGTTAAMGLASAGVTALSGGNLKDIVRSGVTGAIAGYGAEVLGPAAGKLTGVTNAAGQAAMGAGAAGAGTGLLQGKSIKDSVKDGMTSAAIAGLMVGADKGFNTQVDPVTGKVVSAGTPQQSSSLPISEKPDWLKEWQASGGNQPITPDGASPAVYNGQTTTAPVASTNAAFDQALANAQAGGAAPGTAPTTSATPMASSNAAFDQALANAQGGSEKSWWDATKDYFSPTSRAEAGNTAAIESVQKQFPGVTQDQIINAPASSVLGKAYASAAPGILSTYGPAVAAGLGATALLGGFKQQTPQPSQESMDVYTGQATRDLMAAAPKDYYVQNLPGVQYDDKGAIIGSSPWTPRAATQTEVASSNYIPYAPAPVYQTPGNSIGSRQVAQPYNTASMYDFRPRYAAQGGFMETQGAFPANPLTMQSSPMMAMDSHRLPMNTPGVPMNTPMGFAEGGIASLSPQHFAIGGGVGDTVIAAVKKVLPRLKDMLSPITDYNKPPVSPTAGGGGTAPVASAVASTLQNAGYGAPAAAPSPAPQVTAPQVTAPQVAPVQYTPVPYVVPNAPLTTADASELFAQRLYPSLYDADFQARLRQGARRPQQAAPAGIASLAVGGYPRRTGQISGPGTETSDSIPAMLSDGEFVMTAKAVKGMGGGSRRAGAKKMYALMHRLEKNAARG